MLRHGPAGAAAADGCMSGDSTHDTSLLDAGARAKWAMKLRRTQARAARQQHVTAQSVYMIFYSGSRVQSSSMRTHKRAPLLGAAT